MPKVNGCVITDIFRICIAEVEVGLTILEKAFIWSLKICFQLLSKIFAKLKETTF